MTIPVVLIACLVLGYILKKWMPTDNKYIPTILVVVGALLGCVANKDITLASIVGGAVTGLASTGLHQVFKQLIENNYDSSDDTKGYDEDTAEANINNDTLAAKAESDEAAESEAGDTNVI